MNSCRRIKGLFFAITLFLVVIGTYVVAAGNVSTSLTPDDITAIQKLALDLDCADSRTFDGQVHCATSLQTRIATLMPNFRCAQDGEEIEPLAFLTRGYGCCFDRARLMEKTFKYYGITTRHVAIYSKKKYGILSVLIPGLNSHSTLEILTPKGWMGVDSNDRFVLITLDHQPLSYADLRRINFAQLITQPKRLDFFQAPFAIIYGLYSRHGQFHGPDLPAPEIYWPDFLMYNFF